MSRWTLDDEKLRLAKGKARRWAARASAALAVGVVAVAPLALTIWVLWLVLQIAATLGGLITAPVAAFFTALFPGLDDEIRHPVFAATVNIIVVVAALVTVGMMAKGVVGQVVGEIVEGLITRIPVGRTVYGSARQLIATFHAAPAGAQNVVLIEFPSPEMRTIGLVTNRFKASDTGEELAAVYVPTTPNPTSGYVEIVPVARLVWLDWSVNDAIQFIVSAGVIAPDAVKYRQTGRPEDMAPEVPGPPAP
ncbi:MAG: DUF502 domain-containing protein [Phenylobacterium sp.]|nr:DUF502 domain-containing protein [Phenylobacterium sp.]